MKLIRPLIRWTLLLAVLAALGTVTFQVVRHRPRWTLRTSDLDIVHLSPDGRHVLDRSRVWDTHDGSLVHEMFEEYSGLRHWHTAVRGSLLAGVVGDNELWLVDWVDGSYWELPRPEDPDGLRFSDSGRLLLIHTNRQPRTFVFDVATKRRKVVADGLCKHISSDDRLLFLRKFPSNTLSVVEVETGKPLAELPLTTQDVAFAANGKRFVAGLQAMQIGPLDDPVKSPTPLSVYELSNGKLKETPLKFDRDPRRCGVLTPDGEVLITWLTPRNEDATLDFVEAGSGQTIASHAFDWGGGGQLSPDSSLFAFVASGDICMFDARTGALLWTGKEAREYRFLPGGKLVTNDFRGLTLRDARTGEDAAGIPIEVFLSPMPFRINPSVQPPWPKATPNGRYLHVRGEQRWSRTSFFWEPWLDKWLPHRFGDGDVNVVVETATGRELFRISKWGDRDVRLSDDGSTLMTIDMEARDNFVLRFWDVHPRRAWIWALAVVGGAWAGGWSLRLWSRNRARRALSAPPEK